MKDYILLKNKDFVAIYKPLNIPMVKYSLNLKDYLKVEYLRPLYNIEAQCGGILIYALNQDSFREMYNVYKNNGFQIDILAVTVGRPKNNVGNYTAHIIFDKNLGKFTHIPQLVTGATTFAFDYKVCENQDKISLVKLNATQYLPESMRFALADLQAPVFGDSVYGGDTLAKNTNIAFTMVGVRFTGKKTGEYYNFRAYPPESKPWSYFDVESILKI